MEEGIDLHTLALPRDRGRKRWNRESTNQNNESNRYEQFIEGESSELICHPDLLVQIHCGLTTEGKSLQLIRVIVWFRDQELVYAHLSFRTRLGSC